MLLLLFSHNAGVVLDKVLEDGLVFTELLVQEAYPLIIVLVKHEVIHVIVLHECS